MSLINNTTSQNKEKTIREMIKDSFSKISPYWPLENLIAVNPLQGLEKFPIEEALKLARVYFEDDDLPEEMLSVNRETIKWVSCYCDEGDSSIVMPLRHYGLYYAWRHLAFYDDDLHKKNNEKKLFLKMISENPEQVIEDCFFKLGIKDNKEEFLTLLLTTLPGWASYINYIVEWKNGTNNCDLNIDLEYLAIRMVITTLFWPQAKSMLLIHKKKLQDVESYDLREIEYNEKRYRRRILNQLKIPNDQPYRQPKAQFIFCIDVRSEPFRKNLESIGDYETFGTAGFFGIPLQVTNSVSGYTYSSCPVLLKPKHELFLDNSSEMYRLKSTLKRIYQSLKFNFGTPFILAETLGLLSGLKIGLKTFFPFYRYFMSLFSYQKNTKYKLVNESIKTIPFEQQCSYAENALKIIGLTDNFSPIVVFCGHVSSTNNNAYCTSLDCGACGGHSGGHHAKVLSEIMNSLEVRSYLNKKGIVIPTSTQFIAAEHNTTTDDVVLLCEGDFSERESLKKDLERARDLNRQNRLKNLPYSCQHHAYIRSQDFAQTRPEWGLSRNACFVIGPRNLTSSSSLEGRCFLHSYDYKQDVEGDFLTTILTAPVIVAQWINAQYLFSTINNTSYGAGSKVTKNVTGKIGVMQGNASDLMTGLPLQSLYETDDKKYHEPQRLFVIVHAFKKTLDKILSGQESLKKLFINGWVHMAVIEPDRKIYLLSRELTWTQMN